MGKRERRYRGWNETAANTGWRAAQSTIGNRKPTIARMRTDEPFLAPYAVGGAAGTRAHPEPDDPLRSPFERDRHRIIECTAFRRLEHKTQVFLAGSHDHFRTRLTHTLEVAQIARTLASCLRASDDVAEAIALAHDLGHPPFGHAGEAALNLAMADVGGFNHNVHSLRVVEYLEHPFPAFRGLNLTFATRAGLAAHATRYDLSAKGTRDLQSTNESPSVEAQIVSLADRIAYNVHDLEDAIGAGLISDTELAAVRLWRDAFEHARRQFGNRPIAAVRRVVLDRILDQLLADACETSKACLSSIRPLEGVSTGQNPLVWLSVRAEALLSDLENSLAQSVYRHGEVASADARGQRMVLELFEAYRKNPSELPQRFASRIDEQGLDRVIGDYLAGMTDRFCQREHKRVMADT